MDLLDFHELYHLLQHSDETDSQHHLSDEEARTLIVVRERGCISNGEYRTINGVDTLTASAHLRRLRGVGLLEQKGRGNTTFYVPTQQLLAPGITAEAPLSGELKAKIDSLKKRATLEEMKNLIQELCTNQPMKLSDIAMLLERHPKYVREHYLNNMVKLGKLELTFPENPHHPQQAYRTKP